MSKNHDNLEIKIYAQRPIGKDMEGGSTRKKRYPYADCGQLLLCPKS